MMTYYLEYTRVMISILSLEQTEWIIHFNKFRTTYLIIVIYYKHKMSSPPTLYKEVSEAAYSMPGFNRLPEGEECEIVEINGDISKLKYTPTHTLSKGPFINVTIKSYGGTVPSSHGITPRVIVIRNGEEMTQTDIEKHASFYFVVKGGKELLSGGRKSCSRKSNKNKRTRRKSLKKQQHRRK